MAAPVATPPLATSTSPTRPWWKWHSWSFPRMLKCFLSLSLIRKFLKIDQVFFLSSKVIVFRCPFNKKLHAGCFCFFSVSFLCSCRSSGISYIFLHPLSFHRPYLWSSSMVAIHNGWTSPVHFLQPPWLGFMKFLPRHLWLFRQRLAQDTPQRGHVEP